MASGGIRHWYIFGKKSADKKARQMARKDKGICQRQRQRQRHLSFHEVGNKFLHGTALLLQLNFINSPSTFYDEKPWRQIPGARTSEKMQKKEGECKLQRLRKKDIYWMAGWPMPKVCSLLYSQWRISVSEMLLWSKIFVLLLYCLGCHFAFSRFIWIV